MNNIYFDTEFEGLFPNAGLISIGLSDKSGKELFYVEFKDTYNINSCSEFCKNTVLPLLEGGNVSKTINQARIELWQWIVKRGDNAVLICDSPNDIVQINVLFPRGLPPNCSYRVINLLERWKRRLLNSDSRIHKQHNLRHHHALDDAIVNRIIFEGK